MGGLIPLVLKPSMPSICTNISPRSPTPRPQLNMETLYVAKPKPRPLRSQAQVQAQAQPVPVLPSLPRTSAEWKRTISEIRRLHLTRRYRQCASKCSEILDLIKPTTEVEPLYLIYLHFYAATSTELCARPLLTSSPYRTTLLQQARSHFDKATKLVQDAEDSVTRKVRPSSVSSTWSSSCHSPADSVSSNTWTADTRLTSPTTSVSSFEDLSKKSSSPPAAGKKRVKKVSFSLPPEEEIEIETVCVFEVIIRPDSPTLGFEADEDYFHAGAALRGLPELPKAKESVELPLQTVVEEPYGYRDGADSKQSYYSIDNDDDYGFMATGPVHRLYEHLADLRSQLARHSDSVEAQLPPVSYLPSSPTLAGSPDDAGSEATTPTTPVAPPLTVPDALAAAARARGTSLNADLRMLDRQARIERLRRNGWQRKRFDARRYEELCETAMAELE